MAAITSRMTYLKAPGLLPVKTIPEFAERYLLSPALIDNLGKVDDVDELFDIGYTKIRDAGLANRDLDRAFLDEKYIRDYYQNYNKPYYFLNEYDPIQKFLDTFSDTLSKSESDYFEDNKIINFKNFKDSQEKLEWPTYFIDLYVKAERLNELYESVYMPSIEESKRRSRITSDLQNPQYLYIVTSSKGRDKPEFLGIYRDVEKANKFIRNDIIEEIDWNNFEFKNLMSKFHTIIQYPINFYEDDLSIAPVPLKNFAERRDFDDRSDYQWLVFNRSGTDDDYFPLTDLSKCHNEIDFLSQENIRPGGEYKAEEVTTFLLSRSLSDAPTKFLSYCLNSKMLLDFWNIPPDSEGNSPSYNWGSCEFGLDENNIQAVLDDTCKKFYKIPLDTQIYISEESKNIIIEAIEYGINTFSVRPSGEKIQLGKNYHYMGEVNEEVELYDVFISTNPQN